MNFPFLILKSFLEGRPEIEAARRRTADIVKFAVEFINKYMWGRVEELGGLVS